MPLVLVWVLFFRGSSRGGVMGVVGVGIGRVKKFSHRNDCSARVSPTITFTRVRFFYVFYFLALARARSVHEYRLQMGTINFFSTEGTARRATVH